MTDIASTDASEWKRDTSPCRKCRSDGTVKYRFVEDDQGHEDAKCICEKCGARWWEEGTDA